MMLLLPRGVSYGHNAERFFSYKMVQWQGPKKGCFWWFSHAACSSRGRVAWWMICSHRWCQTMTTAWRMDDLQPHRAVRRLGTIYGGWSPDERFLCWRGFWVISTPDERFEFCVPVEPLWSFWAFSVGTASLEWRGWVMSITALSLNIFFSSVLLPEQSVWGVLWLLSVSASVWNILLVCCPLSWCSCVLLPRLEYMTYHIMSMSRWSEMSWLL